jgi:hypothetical protein
MRFSASGFFMNQFPELGRLKFFLKLTSIFAAEGAPLVSLTLVAKRKVLSILFGHLQLEKTTLPLKGPKREIFGLKNALEVEASQDTYLK